MLTGSQNALAAAAAVGALAVVLWLRPNRKRGQRLPGPPARFLVGNLFDLPKPEERGWLVYGDLCDKYGPIIQLDVLNTTLIVLDNAEDVKQLFGTRNTNYSNRIPMTMVNLIGGSNWTPSQQPGDEFRARRRLMNKMLGTGASGARSMVDVQERAVRYFVRRVAAGQVGLNEGIKYMSGYLIVKTAYGYAPREKNDPFIDLSEKSLTNYLDAHDPSWIVNAVPLARFLPSWLPGTGWKRTALEWRRNLEAADSLPFAWARQQIEAGTAAHSFTRQYLTDPEDAVEPELLRNTLSSLYSAASDTTQATSQYIFVALALHPEVQARAQSEIDAVTQGERLPVLEDRPRLPYIDAVLKEVQRWQTIAAIGAHTSVEDDEYKGYHIPGGSMIMVNIWRILHNPQKYPEPDRFNPDRFMKGDSGLSGSDRRAMNPELVNEDPWHYIYGFGLRQCPGRHMADATLWLVLAHVLATVNVRDPVRADGSRITLETMGGPLPGFVGRTEMTSCSVEFRSAKAEALLTADEAASL